ncbi:hypothetical protein F5I97DRAFT_1937335 [Phlebopus sp. FC_14]|nr:hypothetical protein F5I97DRAFT_1937335 [Phlebopus sp. FC_14]
MAQPPPSKFTLKGLLSFPYRLCNPPPAVGKVRSCGVTPVLDVRLDDVLARQHLPPLGLKDFEEYLLYVEHAPENLYFIMWLKEYAARYQAWAQRAKASLVSKSDNPLAGSPRQGFRNPPPPDPSLALFYARAKQTFFTPNAEYELNIPSDVLAPFHCPSQSLLSHSRNRTPTSLWHAQSAHPDPAVFTEVAIEARNMLNESLSRFVRAAYTNVGSRRAACGIIAGCFFTLIGGVLPLIMTTGRWNMGPHIRLIRLVAFPGLWFGLTILVASLQGICIMIYIFGDLRQLRKFELARPAISRPIPASISAPLPPVRVASVQRSSIPLSRHIQSEKDPEDAIPTSPATVTSGSSFGCRGRSFSPSSKATSCESCESESCSSDDDEIDVSPAFFDDIPAPEGPATASCLHRPEYRPSSPSIPFPSAVHPHPRIRTMNSIVRPHPEASFSQRIPEISSRTDLEYGPTAGFIERDYDGDSQGHLGSWGRKGTQRGRSGAEVFDFDMLPTRQPISARRSNGRLTSDATSPPPISTGSTKTLQSASSQVGMNQCGIVAPSGSLGPAIGRAQYKCNQRAHPLSQSLDSEASDPSLLPHVYSTAPSSTPSPDRSRPTSAFALLLPSFTAGVPAFSGPLTMVRSPVVKRAQWEVVVRAAALSMLVTSVLLSVVIAVVP